MLVSIREPKPNRNLYNNSSVLCINMKLKSNHFLLIGLMILVIVIIGCTQIDVSDKEKNQEGETTVSNVLSDFDNHLENVYTIKGKPFCNEVPQKYSPWYQMRLVDPNDDSKYFIIDLDESFMNSDVVNYIKNKYSSIEFGFFSDVEYTAQEDSCYETLEKISVKKENDLIYIRGKVSTAFPGKIPSILIS